MKTNWFVLALAALFFISSGYAQDQMNVMDSVHLPSADLMNPEVLKDVHIEYKQSVDKSKVHEAVLMMVSVPSRI